MYFNKKETSKYKLIKELKASWWVLMFIVFTYMLALKTSHDKEMKIAELKQQLDTLNQGKSLALMTKERLFSEIDSQKDPLWVEMILMKKLGVMPEGYTKVRFRKERD